MRKQNQTPKSRSTSRKKTPEKPAKEETKKLQLSSKKPVKDTKKDQTLNQSQSQGKINTNDPPRIIKGILKKPKIADLEQSQSALEITRNQMSSSMNEPVLKSAMTNHSDKLVSNSTPLSIVSAYHSLNQQHLATQTVDSAFEEYLKVQEELAARGEIEESIKNLQEGLNERLSLYPSSDRGVWLISKLLAEIGIRLAVRCLNNEKVDKANQFLKLARKHTEPLPNSDWNQNPEWILTRKNVFKNLALYYQKKEEWSKAFDCFKVSLKLEKDLKENTANTSLTCAVILSKLNRYAESLDYAQSCMNQVESQLNIDRTKPLGEYKYLGSDTSKMIEYDKQMTTYAISLHLLGKNLANLKYIKEAKVFLSKAQYVAVNMLHKPKQDLQLAINNDLNNLQKIYKSQLNSTKKTTIEDIETSLMTIKTNLANSSYSQLADQQEQKALIGTVTDGPPVKTVKKEPEVKGKKVKGKTKFVEDSLDKEDEDDDKQVFDFVKRFADEKRKKDNQALETYQKKVQQDFNEKQQEFLEKQKQQKFATKTQDPNKPVFKASGQFTKEENSDKKGPIAVPGARLYQESKFKNAKSSRSQGPPNKKDGTVTQTIQSEDDKSQRIKKPTINPAAEGAKLDRKGIKYSGDKGNKNFFNKRKYNIERVNERLGFGLGQENSDDEMTDWQGATIKANDDNKKSTVNLPPIKGYKVNGILGNAGERVLQKYEGYQSDQSQKNKQMFNTNDPGTRKLLQTIESQYRKQKPSSLKEDQDKKDEDSDELERETASQQYRNPNGQIKEFPIYKPPSTIKKPDWRDEQKSSTDDELPDPKKIIEKINLNRSQIEDPSLKFSIHDDEGLSQRETKEEMKIGATEEIKANEVASKAVEDVTKNQRSTIFNKPPRASILVPRKKPEEEKQTPQDQKEKKTQSTGKVVGLTPKGSPRGLSSKVSPRGHSEDQSHGDKSVTIKTPGLTSQNDSIHVPAKHNRGKQASQSKSQQSRKTPNQYVPPSHRKRDRQRIEDSLWNIAGEDSDERRQRRLQNKERLLQLSQPKPKQYVLVKEDDEDEDDREAKAKMILEKVEKGKQINFSDYVDRDVPYIKNNTIGSDSQRAKIKEFDTKMNNKSGLFSKFREPSSDKQSKDISGEVKYIQDKKAKKGSTSGKTPKGSTSVDNKHRKFDENMPEFLKRAKGIKDDDDEDDYFGIAQGNNFKSFIAKGKKQSGKDLGLQHQLSRKVTGLKNVRASRDNGISNLSLKELRQLEIAAATYIQKIVKGYFIRKWYLNIQVRQRLGIPYSGLELTQNAFLRYFQQQNLQLQEMLLVPSQKLIVVSEQDKFHNMLQKSYKHNKNKYRQRDRVDDGSGSERALENTFQDQEQKPSAPQRPRRIPKGATPDQLLKNLQKDFIAHGLDAYSQFKKIGSGIEHDDNGKQIKKNQNTQAQQDDDLLLKDLEPKVPRWVGDSNQFLEVNEIDGYLQKINKDKSSKKEDVLPSLEISAIEKSQKQQFTSSLAALASMHGVFKKATPLSKKGLPETTTEDDDIQALLNKRRAIDEDEEYFPVEKYQEFSREAIVFYKRIGDALIKWTVQAGVAFKKDKKFYMPIKILGENAKSRNTILVYLMNLELLKISKDINKNFEFETIWPFILYLFNNWVRHQVKLMGLLDQRPELKDVFVKDKPAMYEVQEFDQSLKEVKEDYNDMLNFSSELEYDERFKFDEYKENHRDYDQLIDTSKPKELRQKPMYRLKEQRQKMFNAYKKEVMKDQKKNINMYEQLMQKMDQDNNQMQLDEDGKPIRRVRIKLDDIYEPLSTRKQNPFEYFLKMHFVPLPQTDPGQYKLIQNLQAVGYKERHKNNGLNEDSVALMNEERRKRKGLPPLQIIDYNCIDRAALKIKIIIDCLYLRRQLNGWCLVPRDVKESLLQKEWNLKRQKSLQVACKQEMISVEIYKRFGLHVQYPKQFNQRAVDVQQSVIKVNEYKSRRQISVDDMSVQKSTMDQHDDHSYRHQELDDEILVMSSHRDSYRQVSRSKFADQSRSQIGKSQLRLPIPEEKEFDKEDEDNQERQDAIGKLMDMQKTKQEVEDFIREDEILEQGVVKIEDNHYIMTIIFKKIKSNYENMRALIDSRVKDYERQQEDDGQGRIKIERMKSRLCEIVSLHPQVQRYDLDNHNDIREMERIDIEQEKFTKQTTQFKSYAEIKVCSKISTTNWDDSFNINWETFKEFFKKFHIKWSPTDFLTRRRFNAKERFLFYNFFAYCLYIYDCKVQLDLEKFDVDDYKFNQVYFKLEEIKKYKDENHVLYYYDDILEKDFDESKFDYPVFPFYEDPKLVEDRIRIDETNVYHDYEITEEDQEGQSLTVQIIEGNKKPELLIDDKTREYMQDPTSMFNLTLSRFPESDGIYLGQIQITSKDGYKSTYNLRIDYYMMGYNPILQIKAFSTIYHDIYDLKVNNRKTIKDVIRICNQSQMKMVVNQLQSMLSINKKINGSYLKLNFNVRRDKSIHLGQNYINMLICNETLMRSMQKDNYRQFQGIVYFENLGGRMLVTVTEFEIDLEQLSYNTRDSQMLHGNKHMAVKRPEHNKGTGKNLLDPKKRFQKARIWKVNIFNIFNNKNYEAVISYEDLIDYYESEVFRFYQQHPNMIKPNLVYLLQDYIRNLFVYRTKVGNILYWKLPHFRRPLDDNGQVVPVSSDQLYQLKLLKVYHTLQKRIDEQNRDEDNNALPFSLDQMKAKKYHREPPSLSLRNKLILEKELPIFSQDDTRILKLSSSSQEIIVQVAKQFPSLNSMNYAIVTVILYPAMECWMWQIYFLKTQRTFSVTFYPSDLFNMDHQILNNTALTQAKNPAAGLWTELVKKADLIQNPSGDIILTCESYREPLKEILFQDHVFNENAQDVFFMEVTLKSYSNYVTDVKYSFYPLDLETDELNEYTIGVRAYSLTRNIWIKDFQPLVEIVRILRKEKYLTNDVKLLYYSMLRDAATLLAHKIVFSDEAKTTEIKRQKLTYDIRDILNQKDLFQKMQEEVRDPPSPDKKKRLDRKIRKDEAMDKRNMNKMDDTADIMEKEKGLRPEWKTQIELNKIIYQGVASQNPVQVCTIIYNDVKDEFIYRLYRSSDCSVYEKRLTSNDIMRTCAPNYQVMLKNKMISQLGERIADYYKTNMLVASLMSYYNIKK